MPPKKTPTEVATTVSKSKVGRKPGNEKKDTKEELKVLEFISTKF